MNGTEVRADGSALIDAISVVDWTYWSTAYRLKYESDGFNLFKFKTSATGNSEVTLTSPISTSM